MSIWLTRAGSNGEQQELCLTKDVVTIGWTELPNLSSLDERDQLKEIYRKIYPNDKPGAVNNRAGQIWAFAKKIKIGDLVVLPLKDEPLIAIGEVQTSYEYAKDFDENANHIIKVRWIDKEIPKHRFDQDLLYSFGAFMTVCQIKRNDAEERIRAILAGKALKLNVEDETDEDDSPENFDLESVAHTRLVKFINQKFKGHGLESLVEEILKAEGYVTNKTGKGADGGADILAGSGPMGFESPRILIEVKSGDSLIGSEAIDRMRGSLERFGADYGLFIAFNGFKSGIKRNYRQDFFKIRLWDQNDLISAIYKNYDRFSEELKTEIPLQRVWTLVEG